MSKIIVAIVAGGLALAPALVAQQETQPSNETMGRGRGGAPFAWNDKDKDGLCDLTGKAVGQRHGGRAFARGKRGGRNWGRGMRRGANACPRAAAPAGPVK